MKFVSQAGAKFQALLHIYVKHDKSRCQVYRHISSLLDATKPLLLRTEVADEQELDAVCQQLVIDVYSDPFQATWTLTTLLVEKA